MKKKNEKLFPLAVSPQKNNKLIFIILPSLTFQFTKITAEKIERKIRKTDKKKCRVMKIQEESLMPFFLINICWDV